MMSESKSEESPNPYSFRNHENTHEYTKGDVRAMASLLGTVGGALGEIDRQNVGGQSENIRAKKMDPKAVLKGLVGGNNNNQQPVMQQPAMQQPVMQQPMMQQPAQSTTELENRIQKLEHLVETYKQVTKFKRGVSYNVTTSKISGEFKCPITIMDIISTEIAKQTKTITLKLNDKTKN